MSLPLTRRIARAALLVAAGAAPVVGAAGSASALDHSLAPTGGLPGLSALDTAATDSAVDSATGVVGETGGKAVDTAVPATQQLAGDPAGGAGEVLGRTAGAATESAEAPAAGALGGGLPNTGALPGAGLMGGLPIGG
ncbi:ATP-binding protein [Streptomyces sp. NPDC006339]|uniref:ATP-binding protein n=1 Tax=Streptomyces sp. NPDC006339 TaxID=3156755 RepID=UPI0033B746C8